ncbi:SdrD B-like domain-containing protein, partial [Marinicella litoralis]
MLVISSVAYSDITGTIYRDFDADGQQALLEPGLAGVLINAYDATGAVVGNSPQTSAFDGSYTLTGISSDVRVEFTLPIDGSLDFIKNGAIGTNNSTSVVFATDGQIIDYGFNNPSDFCESDPQLTSSCFVNGDPLPAMSPAGALDVLVTWPRSRVGNSTPPDHIAFGRELGSVWGLTWDNEREILFASAFLRRHAGMGPDGMGGIYQIDLSNMASPVISSFLAVPNVGLDPRVEDMVPLPTDPTAQSEDTTAFDSVGKRSLGDMDISDDNSTLYVMNLNTQSLISIDIDTAVITNTFPVTNPGCAAASDVRPFGVEFHDGEVYIGVVCSAESTNDTNDLDAYVLRLNAGVFVNHFGPINMDYPRTNAFNNAAGLIPWNPWSATFQTTATSGFDGSDVNSVYPQPVLSDIEFDSIDGSMILGFLDRQGVQTGAMNLTPDGTQTVQTIAAGDILRVCSNGMGGYVLENSGVCLGNGSGTNAGDGPGGGEYYDNEFFSNHKETSIGGLSHIPGTNEVVSTVMDPFAFRSGGVRIFNNFNGGLIDGFEVYEIDAVGTFGKAVGLGDVELMCGPPPMEIGNRVWCDNGSGVSANDGNGIQDPGEAGVSGVNLTLTCGTESADVLTDGSGHYLFTDPVWSASGNSLSSVIPRDSSCTVSIDMTVPANDTAVMSACGLITPTQLNATSALLNDEIRDSNGSTTMPSMIVAMVNTTGVNTTGGPGENDHTIDFGFGPTLQLGDFVWFDTNQDGIQDGGEPGVNGVTVNLYDNATCTAPIFMTTTTLNGGLPAADGYYNFGPLFPGSYCVEFSDL